MIYVLGSINLDTSLEVERIPKKGETLIADGCSMGLGGKGANQAVAIAKLGAPQNKMLVQMIGCVGKDATGSELVNTLEGFGVGTSNVRKVNRATGSAMVIVTPKDNRIIVYGGANSGITKTDIDEALCKATSADTLLCQLEVPLYVVAYALRKARSLGMTTILNPAPAKALPDDLFYSVDVIIPNEVETQELTGIVPRDPDSIRDAVDKFHERGVQYVVLTLGERGIALSDGNRIFEQLPAYKVAAVDTTGAGDTFVGAFALTYPHIGMYSFKEACAFANRAASIAVTRRGASESIPSAEEVNAMYVKEIKK